MMLNKKDSLKNDLYKDTDEYKREKTCLVSVVIPLFNHEKYIKETLDSIIAQDHPEIEIILVDDASSDDGLQLAKNILKSSQLPHTIIENNLNKGVCATVNSGINEAKGKYTCLIASDDMMAKGRIKRHVKILEECLNPSVIACHGPLQVITEDGTKIGLKGSRTNNKKYELTSVVTKEANPCLQGCTFITKKLKKFPFDEKLFFEDWDFFIRLFLDGYDILYDEGISSYYRVVPGGVSKQIDKMVKARHAIRNKHFKAIASKDLKLAKKFDFTIAFWNFVGISHTGEMKKWIRALLSLMISNPIYSFVRIRDIGWSFKTLIGSKFRH